MQKSTRKKLIIAGVIAGAVVGVWGLVRAETSGSGIAVTSIDQVTDRNLMASTSTTSVAVSLMSQTGANINDVSVHVRVLANGAIANEAPYDHQSILHDRAQQYWLTLSNMPAGTYTIAVVIFNADGSVNAAFNDLGSVTLTSANGAVSGPSTTTPSASTPGAPNTGVSNSNNNNNNENSATSNATSNSNSSTSASASSGSSVQTTTVTTSTTTTNGSSDNGTSGSSGTTTTVAAGTIVLPPATVGVPYSAPVSAGVSGPGPWLWFSLEGLPGGLSLAFSTGTQSMIVGTPTVAVPPSVSFSIKVTNGVVSSTQPYVININP